MALPRMNDYQRKRQIDTLRRVSTPQGGSIPEIDRNVTTVGTGQIAVTSTPQQISFVSRAKLATKITNLGSTDIFWGTIAGLTVANGDLLPGGRGNWISIPGASVVFVVCAAGQTGSISWAEAYDDE